MTGYYPVVCYMDKYRVANIHIARDLHFAYLAEMDLDGLAFPLPVHVAAANCRWSSWLTGMDDGNTKVAYIDTSQSLKRPM